MASQCVATTMDRLVCRCLDCLSNLIRFSDNSPLMFSEWQRIDALKMGQGFLDAYTVFIASDFANKSSPGYSALWKARPKCHTLWHAIDHLRHSRQNVFRLWSCWQEEDLMGKVSKVCKRTHPNAGALRTLQRYFLALHVDYVGDTDQ